jgi:cysteine desulfurase/selenocysteine lyase
MYDVDKVRQDFPILKEKIGGKTLVYLDSAATSQKPKQVVDTVSEFYFKSNANVARGLHRLGEEATRRYEEVRFKTKDFINAKSEKEILFMKNTTEAANTVMYGWGMKNIKEGDKLVTTILEHHSNFVPWQQLAKMKRAKLEIIDIDADGFLKEDELDKIKGAKFVALSAASNVLGTLPDVKRICKIARDSGAISFVDGAQSVPSMKTDVRDMGCDFLAFSGHKMLAPFGTGVLYGKEEVLQAMDPFLYGSEMIHKVTVEESTWNELPYKFEAGTPVVAETMGLGTAMDYMRKLGMDNIRRHKEDITSYALKRLGETKGVRILGPKDASKRAGLVAFELEKVHPHDVAAILDDSGIAIRSGHHCAMPLHLRLNIPASSRASFHVYTKKGEIDALITGLEKVKMIFGAQ